MEWTCTPAGMAFVQETEAKERLSFATNRAAIQFEPFTGGGLSQGTDHGAAQPLCRGSSGVRGPVGRLHGRNHSKRYTSSDSARCHQPDADIHGCAARGPVTSRGPPPLHPRIPPTRHLQHTRASDCKLGIHTLVQTGPSVALTVVPCPSLRLSERLPWRVPG